MSAADSYLRLDARRVTFDITRLRERFPEIEEDDELLTGMIEGETEIDSVVTRLYRAMREDEAMAAGAKAMMDDLAARQKRFEARAEAKKAMVLAILEAASLPKLALPIATFTVSDGKPSVVIQNADEIPQGFAEIIRKPKAAEIKKALLAGETVPGATLEWASDYLTIRSK